MSFSAAWLELREPYDRRARNAAVIDAVAAALAEPAVGHDRRSCLRHRLDACARSAPRSRRGRTGGWSTTISACSRARRNRRRPDVNVTTVPIDLNRDLEAALDGPVDLVTTSALLDLVSDEWLRRLAVEAAARRLPVYAALSYDGRVEMTPADPPTQQSSPPSTRISAPTRALARRSARTAARSRDRAVRARRLCGHAGRGPTGCSRRRIARSSARCCRAGRPRRATSATCRCPTSSAG